jgi:hypothetical protein
MGPVRTALRLRETWQLFPVIPHRPPMFITGLVRMLIGPETRPFVALITRAGRLCSIFCPGLNHSRARPSDPHQKLRAAATGARPISNSPTRSAFANAARAAASILSGRMHEHARAGVDALNAAPARAAAVVRDDDSIVIPRDYGRTAERNMACAPIQSLDHYPRIMSDQGLGCLTKLPPINPAQGHAIAWNVDRQNVEAPLPARQQFRNRLLRGL